MRKRIKNSIAILGTVAVAFAINARVMRFGALERPRVEDSYLHRVAHSPHLALSRIPVKSSKLSREKNHQPQSAVEHTLAASFAPALRPVGTAFCTSLSTASLLCGHGGSSRAPPLA